MTKRFAGRLAGFAAAAALTTGLLMAAGPAEARGGGGHVFVGFGCCGFGYPYYAGYPAYYPAPYYPAPAYYAPPAYPPAPGYPPTPGYGPAAAPAQPASDCRNVKTTTTIDGVKRALNGVACRQPDGSWALH